MQPPPPLLPVFSAPVFQLLASDSSRDGTCKASRRVEASPQAYLCSSTSARELLA